MPFPFPVYVVDDDSSVRDWAVIACETLDYRCRGFEDGEAFLAALDGLEPGCVLLDMRMPRLNGLDVQARLAAHDGSMAVIAMTGYGDVEVAVQSMRLGAVDFLEKPFSSEILAEALERAFERLRGAVES